MTPPDVSPFLIGIVSKRPALAGALSIEQIEIKDSHAVVD